MTTVASTISGEDGQSVIEFLFMLPVMIGLVVLLTQINTTIQVSIVDQQYARAQATWIAFNSAVFPELNLRYSQLVAKNYNQVMLGVADNVTPTEGSYYPKATVGALGRTLAQQTQGSNEPHLEPSVSQGRSQVRVRNTVSLCSQPNIVQVDGAPSPILTLSFAGQGQPPVATGPYHLPENNPQFYYCKGYTE